MIRSFYCASDGPCRTGLDQAEITAALHDPSGLLWVDFVAEPPQACEPLLRDVFGFHPLAVDDALQETHVPKVDDWEGYLYVALHAVILDEDNENGIHLDTLEVDAFLGKNYIVTHHDQTIAAVEHVWANCQREGRFRDREADRLLYRLADELVTGHMAVVDVIDERIERVEDEVFGRPTPATLEQVFALKRALLHLRRILAPQREVLNKLARDDYPVIDAKERIFFRDVYDHLVRLYDINESMRDLVGGVLDAYLSVINNRMNEVMKTLTLITTLFMPISFVAGFFGMNFFQPAARLDDWTRIPSFALMLAVMILLPAGMYIWMRRRRFTERG